MNFDHLNHTCFIYVSRTPARFSKRWTIMFIVNQMLKVYHKIKKFHLTTGLTKTIFMCPDKNLFPIAHVVTFYYYTGCKDIFEGKFNDGELLSDILLYLFPIILHQQYNQNLNY